MQTKKKREIPVVENSIRFCDFIRMDNKPDLEELQRKLCLNFSSLYMGLFFCFRSLFTAMIYNQNSMQYIFDPGSNLVFDRGVTSCIHR